MSKTVEIQGYLCYNNFKARAHAQDIGTAEELPALDTAKGYVEIGADLALL